MLVFLTFGLYALALLAIGILRLVRRSFSYAWLAAALGALLAWGSVLAWQFELPALVLENAWQPAGLFSAWPVFFVDTSAWVYALALSSLALAVILTAPAQSTGVSLSAWVATLGLTIWGLLAFVAANPLTLVLVWVGLDLLELINTLRLARRPDLSERAVVSFGVRLLGTGFALWAMAASGSVLLSFDAMTGQAALFLLLAVGLRLGVLPLHLTYRSEPGLRRGMGTLLRLVVASSSLVLLARLPGGLLPGSWAVFLQALLVVALLYGAWKWISVPSELGARPYWLIGMAALALLAAVRGNPLGSVAWGAGLVLFGGLVFLYSARKRVVTMVLSALVLMLFALPFSLTATAWQGTAPFDWIFWPFVVAGQVLLALGFVRHLWHTSESDFDSLPRWAQSAYPLGLLILVAMILLLGLWGWPGALQVGSWPVGVVVGLLSVTALAIWWRIGQPGGTLRGQLASVSAQPLRVSRLAGMVELFASFLWGLYRSLRRLVDFFSDLLEGDGGLLWTVLVLVLLLLWFQQI